MYNTQLLTEITLGKHNISQWVQDFIKDINQEDINLALTVAETFLTEDRSDLDDEARIKEIQSNYGLGEASQLIVDSILEAVVLIQPTIVVRGGKEVAMAGVAPIQAIATQIGNKLHRGPIDAVTTGIQLLSAFQHIGIFDVRVVKEGDRAVNRNGIIEAHGDSAVIIPTMEVSLDLYSAIRATRYLPPMLMTPNEWEAR
jgi:hypothetical protein